VDLLDDSPVFGRIVEGDIVLTAGGTESLAPPDIPVGIVRNVVNRSSAEGPLLEIETLANLDRLHFVSVVLYKPDSEVTSPIATQADG
jgi:rod shape-determining protein MreC